MNSFAQILGLSTLVLASTPHAGFIPPAHSGSMVVGSKLTFNSVLATPASGATEVDVFFLVDDTGSMGSIIANAKAGATSIFNALPRSYRYGVASYDADPSEGAGPAFAYNRRTDLTTNRATVLNGINNINANGGGDFPEANLYALQQLATTSSWNPDAQRLVVMFGDAPGHVDTVTTAAAAAALRSVDAKLIAFNSAAAGSGLDGRDTSPAEPAITKQASDIIAQTGGVLINGFASLSNQQFVNAVTAQIASAGSFLDLVFSTNFAGTGLGISIRCTDVLGCNNVAAGTSRSFAVDVSGLKVGSYGFNLSTRGITDIQTYSINVTPVPEPSTAALMLTTLGLWAAFGRRRSFKA